MDKGHQNRKCSKSKGIIFFMTIIGITGTIGAGKGTVVKYLVKEKRFTHFSVRAFIVEEIINRKIAVNRDSMVVIANDLRQTHSSSFIIDELFLLAQKSGRNCIIESIRTTGEIESLRRNKNFYLLAVDADPRIRYERIRKRGSETDHVNFDTFIQNEKREMKSDNQNEQNLSKCIQMADFTIFNNNSVAALYKEVESILKKIKV